MSIVLARLQPRNAQKGWLLKDYTSTRGNSYRAGEGGVPSPLTRCEDEREQEELRGYSQQFEFIEVLDEQELSELLQYEMEMRVRAGGSPIRAEVLGVDVPLPTEPSPPRRRLDALPGQAVPAPRVAARDVPKAIVDEDGDERFIPAPPPSAPSTDDVAPVRSHAAPKKGGRRGRG